MGEMKSIPCTQFLRPDARKRQTYTSRDEDSDVYKKAWSIIRAGYTFTCEELRTGEIVQYITDEDAEIDMDIRVCGNGPQVQKLFDRMVLEFTIPEKGERCSDAT